MALPCYLAVTAAEFAACAAPARLAWMACHFSGYGTGLSNLPPALPDGTMVILNDRIPICGHDPKRITDQLTQLVSSFSCAGVLLDFQRPGHPETAGVCKALADALPCPVGVSELYAEGLSCPVFLSAPPLRKPLQEHLAPWEGRTIWLEAALDSQTVTVTESGARVMAGIKESLPGPCFTHDVLCCRYHWERADRQVHFYIQRTQEDLFRLLAQAEALGVRRAVGLYQELGSK